MKLSVELNDRGFSLIEILLVISLLVVILAVATPNLFDPLATEKLSRLTTDITSLLKDAQTKSMSSETFGLGTTSEFGVHFTPTNYTLFRGTVFNPADSNNFTVSVPPGLAVAPSLPCPNGPNDCNNIVFARLNGEVTSFDENLNSICLADNFNNTILLTTNFLGVIDAQANGC